MDLKLQQAIVATKAGRNDIAQHYLAQLLQDNPDDADAWFLLGHLVDAPERRSKYLNKSVEINPGQALTKRNLVQVENTAVPAAIVMQQDSRAAADDADEGPPDEYLNAVNETDDGSPFSENDELEVYSNREDEWQDLAGAPIRETQSNSTWTTSPAVPKYAPNAKPSGKGTSGDVWLVRILVIMVIVAAIVLGILVLLLLV